MAENRDIKRLEIVVVVVDGDVPKEKRMVRVALFPSDYFCRDPSIQEIMAEILRLDLTLPDLATIEAVRSEKLKKNLVLRGASTIDTPNAEALFGICRDGDGTNTGQDEKVLCVTYPNWWQKKTTIFTKKRKVLRHYRFMGVVYETTFELE